MPPEVTLTIYDGAGSTRRETVSATRYTIGRSEDNDLVLADAGLSRRHALIEIFDGVVQVSDCGSQNGTLVNRRAVTGRVTLKDGDAILIGEACDIRVHIRKAQPASSSPPHAAARAVLPDADTRPLNSLPDAARRATPATGGFSAPLMALAAVVVILFGVGLLILLTRREAQPAPTPEPVRTQAEQSAIPPPPPLQATSPEQELVRKIEDAARRLMPQISSDKQDYYLPGKALEAVKRKVEAFRASASLAEALGAINRHSAKVVEQARHENIEPALVFYTALAESTGGEGGSDPVEQARQALPKLLGIKVLFGTEHAETSLIVVAAYKMGPAPRKNHPLNRIRERLVKDEGTQNNVWYLYEKGGISEPVYDFVVRFLALGIIAQNPRQFQINADPLVF